AAQKLPARCEHSDQRQKSLDSQDYAAEPPCPSNPGEHAAQTHQYPAQIRAQTPDHHQQSASARAETLRPGRGARTYPAGSNSDTPAHPEPGTGKYPFPCEPQYADYTAPVPHQYRGLPTWFQQ